MPLRQFGHDVREYAENVPAAQRSQEPAPAFADTEPNGQGVQFEEPRYEKSPAGQAEHVAEDVAPIAADAVPGEQSKHAATDEAPRLSE